eukprot:64446-Pyramimonas_sp.AAC.1
MTIASKRKMKVFRRSFKLQKLISAGAKVGGTLRAESLAKALWGSGASGLSMKQLLGLRLSTVHSLHKDKKGVSVRSRDTPRSLDSQRQGCQAKQARHDKADTDVCQPCGNCSGT